MIRIEEETTDIEVATFFALYAFGLTANLSPKA
jgi:hypothetical protein